MCEEAICIYHVYNRSREVRIRGVKKKNPHKTDNAKSYSKNDSKYKIHCNSYETFFFSRKTTCIFYIFPFLLTNMININISQSSQILLGNSVQLLIMLTLQSRRIKAQGITNSNQYCFHTFQQAGIYEFSSYLIAANTDQYI